MGVPVGAGRARISDSLVVASRYPPTPYPVLTSCILLPGRRCCTRFVTRFSSSKSPAITLHWRPTHVLCRSTPLCTYSRSTRCLVLNLSCSWYQAKIPPLSVSFSVPGRGQRVVVGYLSSDFGAHTVCQVPRRPAAVHMHA